GVHEPDARAVLAQRERQVGCDRRLADPTLAARHRDQVLDPSQLGDIAGTHGPYLGRHADRDLADTRERRHELARLTLHLLFDGAGWCRELDREGDVAAVDAQLFDETQLDDVAM